MNHCVECGQPMNERIGTHHYVESGLNGIYLENVPVWECDCGYSEVSLPALMNLHELICKALVMSPFPLRGEEIRFIRTTMGLQAKDLATRFNISAVTVSRWENDKTRMNRANAYLFKMMVDDHFTKEKKKFIKMLEDVSLTEKQAMEAIERQIRAGKSDKKFLRFPIPFAGKRAQLALELKESDCVCV